MNWTHESVYDALATGDGRDAERARLYPQRQDCAVIRPPGTIEADIAPLLLYPARPSWREDIYQAIVPAIEAIRLEHESEPRDSSIRCSVRDWNLFARLLQLDH